MGRQGVLIALVIIVVIVAGLIIYRSTRPPVKPLTPEEVEVLKQPGPASPIGGAVGGQ